MDITIRKNEICVVGLPRCDFVFSSTRNCFIAYGFSESALEMSLLRSLLEKRGIQSIEAGGSLAPGQSAYCAKICSKIITSQFCIVLLNNTETAGTEIPSANVNMEYGLMLGFNKYVIPFQRASQKLPFNVAGLDTVKYDNKDFERLASSAIDQAIEATTQKIKVAPDIPIDQLLNTFFLIRGALVAQLSSVGEQNLHELGNPIGFVLLNDFSGIQIRYFGNFTALRPEAVLWRIRALKRVLSERAGSLAMRVQAGVITEDQMHNAEQMFRDIHIWILVTSIAEKTTVLDSLSSMAHENSIDVFTIQDVSEELAKSGFPAA